MSNLVWGFDKADVIINNSMTNAAIKRKDEFRIEGLENLMRWTE